MTTATSKSTKLMVLTNNAALKIHQLMQDEADTVVGLRVYITGGGCSGFQYGFAFEETLQEDDLTMKQEVISKKSVVGVVMLLVDYLSFQYLKGAEIDYKEDIEGARFIIRNPNAKTSCGCGSSFAV